MRTATKNRIRVFSDLVEAGSVKINDVSPSGWAEANRIITENTSRPGPFSFNYSPYVREILDCLSPDHPARVITIMKGAQIGLTTGLIENGLGWIISESPGNVLYLVGHEDLVKGSMNKVEQMIDGSGIRDLIAPQSKRKRNNKSGDTDTLKEFAGGYLKIGVANHKALKNFSLKYGFFDDYDGMKGSSESDGDLNALVMQRFAAFSKKKKVCFISTPNLKHNSNIEEEFLKGDQRKYHIPCPCCSEKIVIEWVASSQKEGLDRGGIVWELDESGKIIPESVGYRCYKCGGFFNEDDKDALLMSGEWIPTNKSGKPDHYSYHISALYAPSFMDGWYKYIDQYMDACPIGQPRVESKWQTFVNVVLGETYERVEENIKATELQRNIRPYKVGLIPEKISEADGNGKIVLLTCGADIGGMEDDNRLDYEIVAWSESGASYSIDHGSIGTFFNGDRGRVSRTKWTLKPGHPNSIFPEFEKILAGRFKTDTGREMKVFVTALDTGFMTTLIYPFIDNSNHYVIGVKGNPDKYVDSHVDKKTFKQSTERGKLFIVESNVVKDQLASCINLKWNPKYHEVQPAWFLNFPMPENGKYLYDNYFAHFEAEHRVMNKDSKFTWKKKSSHLQNHLFDCRCYNIVAKDVLLTEVFREYKIKNGVWADYVNILFGR